MQDYIQIIHEIRQNIPEKEYSEQHDKNIMEGKVLLFLLSTLGEPSFFEWLPSATPKGNYYEFREYKIMRRAERIKDTVRIDNYDDFKKAVKAFAGKDIENPDLLTLLETYFLHNKGTSLTHAQAFLDASILLSAKLARFLARPRNLPGDIITAENEETSTDLIDLYRKQQGITDRSEAVCALAEKFDISNKFFVPVKIDQRTRWTQVREHGDFTTEDDEINFMDGDALCGRVLLKDKQIDDVKTYWTKNLDQTPYRALSVPWFSDAPLWNLNGIARASQTVFVTSSLLGAYRTSHDTNVQLQKKRDQLEELQSNDHYQENIRLELHKEFSNLIKSELERKFPGFEQEEQQVNAPWPTRSNSYQNEIDCAFFCCFSLPTEERDRLLDLQISTTAIQLYKKYYAFKNQWDKPQSERKQLLEKTSSNWIPNVISRNQFSVFHFCLSELEAFMEQKYAKDRQEKELLTEEIKPLGDFAITSWYGGAEILPHVDFAPLRKKKIVYLLNAETADDYKTALQFYREISRQLPAKHLNLTFFVADDEKSSDEFIALAKEKYQLTPEDHSSSEEAEQFADRIDLSHDNLDVKEEPFIFRPLIRRGSISMIYSEPNVGKTFFAQSLALAMLYGTDLFNMKASSWKAERPLRVLYIDSEMSKGSFCKRLRMLHKFYAERAATTASPVLEYKLVAKKDWDLAGESDEFRDQVSRMLHLGTKEQIDFIIFDNLSTLTGGSDSQKSWMTFFAWLRKLSNQGVTSFCLHHSAKSGTQRGTSLRSATLDNIIRLRGLTGNQRSLVMTLTVEKARDVSKADLLPLQLELARKNAKSEDWYWCTALAKGQSVINPKKRDEMLRTAYDSEAFSIRVLAGYFGIEENTAKSILKPRSTTGAK